MLAKYVLPILAIYSIAAPADGVDGHRGGNEDRGEVLLTAHATPMV